MLRHVNEEFYLVLAQEAASVALALNFCGLVPFFPIPLHPVVLIQVSLHFVVAVALVSTSVAIELAIVESVEIFVNFQCSFGWQLLVAGFTFQVWMELVVVQVELQAGCELFVALLALLR